MKKFLLYSFLLAATTLSANAETKFYAFEALGEVGGISSNGQYAAIFDYEMNLGYLWNAQNPETLTPLFNEGDNTYAFDVSNDGIPVGAVYTGSSGKWMPAFYKDGQWQALPVHAAVMNIAEARCISPDGKIIGGYQFIYDASSEIAGRFYPCIWTLNADGEYELTAYTGLPLPDHQGFITMCMTPDGKKLGGRLYCGSGSNIPAIIDNGELKIFNNLETRIEPFVYKGDTLGYFEEYYIDGCHDGYVGDYFNGEFESVDEQGCFYGARTRGINVSEDGNSWTPLNGACIYNPATDEWLDNTSVAVYSSGLNDGQYAFSNDGKVWINNEPESIQSAFSFDTSHVITGVTHTSKDGKVLGGMTQEFNAATQGYLYYPFLLVLDEALIDVSSVDFIVNDNIKAAVIVSKGRIEIAGAEAIVYDLDGKNYGQGSIFNVPAGVYIVKTSNESKKVLVK